MSRSTELIAIYGGTFDPFHRAHAAICQAVLAQPEVSQLRLIPCYLPALKAEASVTAVHRLAMLENWRKTQVDFSRILLDDQEIQRGGASYTVDTIANIAEQNPGSRLIFVLGVDAWNSLRRWHRYEELLAQVSFWVFRRKGEADIMQYDELAECSSLAELFKAEPGRYWLDSSVDLAVSSTDLRASNRKNADIPAEISDYIKEHQLYREVQQTYNSEDNR